MIIDYKKIRDKENIKKILIFILILLKKTKKCIAFDYRSKKFNDDQIFKFLRYLRNSTRCRIYVNVKPLKL